MENREEIIKAIASGDLKTIRSNCSPDGKKVLYADTFLDLLKWTSSGVLKGDDVTLVLSDDLKKKVDQWLENDQSDSVSLQASE